MISSFTIKRTFYRTSVSLTVDCERETADLLAKHNRIIRDMGQIEFWKVSTPEKAERFLSETIGERGSLIETLHARYERLYAAH
jgi:hypothetical protein